MDYRKEELQVLYDHKRSVLKVWLRYTVLLLFLGSIIAYFIIWNPLKFNSIDAIMFKQQLFNGTPAWLFRTIDVFMILIIIRVAKRNTRKDEKQKFEMSAPDTYKKMYLERDVKINKLTNECDYLRTENNRLQGENKKFKIKLDFMQEQFMHK